MSNHQAISVFTSALKGLIHSAIKISSIALAWTFRFLGLALSKIGETIERITIKKSI
jgi:hypothetical protein